MSRPFFLLASPSCGICGFTKYVKLSMFQKLARSIQLQTIPISHTFFNGWCLSCGNCTVCIDTVRLVSVWNCGMSLFIIFHNHVVFPVDRNLYYILNKIMFLCVAFHFLLHALPISAFRVCLVKKFQCQPMQAICIGLFAEPFVLWKLWLCRRLNGGITCWWALLSLRCTGLWYRSRTERYSGTYYLVLPRSH
jgi:hypothetical protein